MPDAFRGLTLRLGADVRPVKTALSSISRSASNVQSQLNKLNKALRFDPTDVTALGARLDLASDKAAHMARGLATVKQAMSQVPPQTKELASATARVYAQTERLKSSYNHVNAELQVVYDTLARVAMRGNEIGNLDGVMQQVVARMHKMTESGAAEYVKQLKLAMEGAGDAADAAKSEMALLVSNVTENDAVAYVKRLRETMDGVGEEAARARKEFEHLTDVAAESTKVNERFEIERKSGEALRETIGRLVAEHSKLYRAGEAAKAAEGYRAMKVEAASLDAQLREAAADAARMRSEFYAVGADRGLANAIADVRRMDTVVEKATASARGMSEAYGKVPSSVAAARSKIRSLATEGAALRDRMQALTRVLDELDGHQFDKAAAKMTDVWGATERAEREYAKLEERVSGARAELEKLVGEYEKFKTRASTDAAEKRMRELKDEIRGARNEVAKLATEQERADATLRSSRAAQTYRETYEEVQRCKAALAEMQARASGVEDVFRTMRTTGYGLYSTITASALIWGQRAVNSANEVDSAYRDMRKTVNGTEEEFEHLRDAALEFGHTHVTSADQILEIEAIGGQLGIASTNLEKFGEVASNLNIATNMDVETISENMGQLSNIMKDMDQNIESGPGSLEAFSDSLVRLGNNSAAQEDKIMNVMMRVASMGTICGMTTPELLALSTATAAAGQGSEAAGTAISRTFSQIETAVGEGTERLGVFAQVSGMSADKFAETWKSKPMEAFAAFIKGLRNVDESGGSVISTLEELGINAVRQRQTLMNLTNTVDVLDDALLMSNDAWQGIGDTWGDAGDAAREAQRKSEGFSGQLQMMKNAAQAFGVELLDGMVPQLKAVTEAVQGAAGVFGSMPDVVKENVVGIGLFAVALGPVMVAVGAVGNGVMKLGRIWEGAHTMWKASRTSLAEVAAALAKNDAAIAENDAAIARNQAKIEKMIAVRDKQCSSNAKLCASMDKYIAKLRAEDAALAKNGANLEKNREEIIATGEACERGGQMMDKFKGALATIGKTAALMVILEVAGAIVDKVGEAVEDMREFDNATNGLKRTADEFAEAAEKAGKAVEGFGAGVPASLQDYSDALEEATQRNIDLAESMAEFEGEAETSTAKVRGYAEDIMELTRSWDGTAESQGKLKVLVDSFNDATGASVGILNEERGTLNVTAKELENYLKTYEKYAYAQAAQKAYQAASEAVAKNKALVDGLKKQREDLEQLAKGEKLELTDDGYAYAISSAEKLNAVREQERKAVLELESAEYAEAAAKENASSATGDLMNAAKNANPALSSFGDELDEEADEADEAAEALEKLKGQFNDLRSKSTIFNDMVNASGVSADEFSQRLSELGLSMDDVASSMENMAQKVSDGFNAIKVDDETGLDKYLENLQHNIEVTRDWRANLDALFNYSPDASWQAWIKDLASKGPEVAAQTVADIVERMGWMTDEELRGYAQMYIDSVAEANDAALVSMGEASQYALDAWKSAAGNISTVVSELNAQGVELYVDADGVVKVLSDLEAIDRYALAEKRCIVTDGGTIEDLSAEFDELRVVEIGSKVFYVTDDGTILDSQGKVSALGSVIREIPDETFTTFTADTSAIGKAEAALNLLSEKDITPVVRPDAVLTIISKIKKALDDNAKSAKPVELDADTSKYDDKVGKVKQDSIDPKEVSIGANTGPFWETVNSLSRTSLPSMTISVYGSYKGTSGLPSGASFASGGVARREIARIPMFASGGINGIVTRPTLTNIGWTGEDGAEAILHVKNAGGAVVPLTNHRYVRPFAQAVASEMGGGGNNVTVNVSLDYSAGEDATRMALDVADRLEAILSMEG